MNTPHSDELPSNDRLNELLIAAQNAAKSAYNPYSRFSVGCALLTKSGQVFCGCNVENASYSVTICAERVAASQAVLQRDLEWDSIVVVSPLRVSMCGICRQFLHEFAPKLKVWCGYLDSPDLIGPDSLDQLLPGAMSLSRIQNSSVPYSSNP
jgi:cytidine deaminase